MKEEFAAFLYEEDGAYTLEVAIITAAIIALALAFRKQLGAMWKKISDTNKDYINKIKN